MTVKSKRIFNYRPLVLLAVALIIGIILGEAVYDRAVWIIITMCVIVFAVFISFAFVKKLRRFSLLPLALLIGMIGITTSNAVFDLGRIDDFSGEFSATVISEIIVDEGESKFKISDIRLNGRVLKYNAVVYMPKEIEPDFGAGDTVKLKGELISQSHSHFDSYYATNRAKNSGYFAFVSEVKKLSDGKLKFPLNIQLAIKKALVSNTDEYTASICQALILGDKSGLNESAFDDISVSGLAHVLAVSGLHITTIAGLMYFVLKKLKVNPKIAFIIVTVVTFLYSMLCSFTASSLRAVIMCGVLMFASAFGKKQDSLSSLALSAILILLFRPTALFEVGFLLSFYAVLGIFMFYAPIKRVGMRAVQRISPKRNIGKRFVDVCAMSLATNIATLPLVAYYFERVPTLFILANFLVLPYMIAFYVVSIIFTLLSLITTFGGFIWILKFLLYPFKFYVALVGNLPFSAISVSTGVMAIICYTLLMIFLSKFIFARRRTKATVALAGSSVSIILCLLGMLI